MTEKGLRLRVIFYTGNPSVVLKTFSFESVVGCKSVNVTLDIVKDLVML